MKRAWFALLAVAGCNAIFGNDQVSPFPFEAGIDSPALDVGTMTVTYAIADSHDANAAPSFTPFDTQVHLGLLDFSPTETATVTGGSFTIPNKFLTADSGYRVIYKAPDGIDVEFQTRLASAHFVVPLIGRLSRGTPQASSSIPFAFSGGPNNQAGSWKLGRFFMTGGLWAEFDLGPCCSLPQPPPAHVSYPTFVSASGALGAPGSNETFVFTDNKVDDDSATPLSDENSKAYAYATMTLDGFDASGAPLNPVISAWTVPPSSAVNYLSWNPPQSYRNRAGNKFVGSVVELDRAAGGILASTTVTPFTENLVNVAASVANTNGDLDHVAMPFLSRSTLQPIRFVNPYNGTSAPSYPTAVYAAGSAKLTFDGTNVTVRSGIQMIDVVPASIGTAQLLPRKDFDDGVSLATMIQLADTTTHTTNNLSSTDHTIVVRNPATSSTGKPAVTLELTFQPELGLATAALPNDCMVTLYRIEEGAQGSLTTIKRYLVITPLTSPLLIDQNELDTTNEYTFGISCYRGHPDAKSGDWRTIALPFASSTIYSHSFKVP